MPDNSGATVLDDLPESVIIEEILVRLPPRDVLRCRAVRRSWRSGTSARRFMVAHHRRQPSLPIICFREEGSMVTGIRFVVFGDAGANCKPVLWWPTPDSALRWLLINVRASCDGLLVVSGVTCRERVYKSVAYICNPTTRQCIPLRLPQPCPNFFVAGMYQHDPSGEYRVLYWYRVWIGRDRRANYYILTVGSAEPRRIQQSTQLLPSSLYSTSVTHRGNLHFLRGPGDILVFDTTVEAFRWIRRPTRPCLREWLLVIRRELAFCTAPNGVVVDIFVMQDYNAQVWVLKYKINLSAVIGPPDSLINLAVFEDRELLIILPGRLLRCDMDGNFIGEVEVGDGKNLRITTHLLQESITPLSFFESQDADGAKENAPFIIGM